MQITSIQLNIKTKQDDSGELSRFFVLLSILLFLVSSCTTTNQLNNSSSPLEIKTGDTATGTGFLFSSSDYVITSYHVVHGSKSISVRFTNGEQIDASIAVKDTNNDIAILKLSKSPTSRQNIITLGDSSSVKTGDRVFTYGFPLVDLLGHQEPRYSEGFVNSLSGMSNDPRLFQVSIPIQPGNSGGPVFNEKGELIGIATSSIDSVQTQKVFGATPQNVNFAIKSSYINSLLPNLPDTFIKQRGIVPFPIEQSSFKERVKNDIVLVEAVPEFKPTVVKRDYKEEERLREERERQVQEEEKLRREKDIVERERELEQRARDYEEKERLRKEQEFRQRERELAEKERELKRLEAQQNNKQNRTNDGLWDTNPPGCEVGCGVPPLRAYPGTESASETYKKRNRKMRPRNNRTGPCYGGMRANPDGSCDIGPLRKRNNKPKGNFNFNLRIGK
jgi:S1-C subfamily serine protease